MIVIGFLAGLVTGGVAFFIPWLPDQASEEAKAIDAAYWFVVIICAVVFALVSGVSVYAAWKFRAPPDDEDDGSPIHGHTGIEIVWTAIPTILVTAMAVFSGFALASAEDLPDDHGTIQVTAQQFAWSFTYPELDDRTEGELVLEIDKPMQLVLTAKDVIHSFWVPEFRMKQDAVPGIETTVPITPIKIGRYDVICTELCGLGHSTMRATVVVESEEAFEQWVSEQAQAQEDPSGGTTDAAASAGSASSASGT